MDSRCRLVALSSLMFFVELMLIRWVGSNIYYLFFFSNFILLASFLGIGIGFLRSDFIYKYFRYTPVILGIFVFFCFLNGYEYQAVLNPLTDNLDYSAQAFKNNFYPIPLTLPIVFSVVVFLMSGIASAVATNFRLFTPLNAYRLEIVGSLVGIILFSLLSYLHQGPVVWGLVIILLYIPLLIDEWRARQYLMMCLQLFMLMLMLGTFVTETMTFQHYWSSYYKIVVQKFPGQRYVVNVNGLPQQIIESVEQRLKVKPFYFVPYQQLSTKKLDDVLVIGAGTGGDVAIALSQGAKHIDAVEIDPMLYKLGKKFNPNHPYADPRVKVYIDDGRAYLQQTQQKYDMIIFALTDSLALVQGQSSIRLENYLYTLEGIQAAKMHLKADGVFTLYNYYSFPWLRHRLANTLYQVFQHTPCITQYSPTDYWAIVYTVSNNKNFLTCTPTWTPNGNSYEIPITDDRPFMYLSEKTLPPVYIFALSILLVAAFCLVKLMGVSNHVFKNNLALFLMGIAFLLLETKNIINFALFFGTTWLVNALVFIGILFTVYLAVEIRTKYSISKKLLSIILIFALILAWFIPNSFILSLHFVLRFLVATVIAFTPILIANILFADQFREADDSTEAFGVNLLGAVLGGVLEYTSMIFGYHELLLMVIGIYILAIININYPKSTGYSLDSSKSNYK